MSAKNFSLILGHFGIFSTIIVFICFLYLILKRIKIDKELKPFGYYLFTGALSSIVVYVLFVFNKTNLWIAHIYFPVSYAICSYMFISWLPKSKQRYLYLVSIVVLILVLIDSIFITEFMKMPVFSVSIIYVVILIFALRFLLWFVKYGPNEAYSNFQFYVVFGLIIYSSESALTYLLFMTFGMWLQFIIHHIATFFVNLIFLYALIVYYRKRKSIQNIYLTNQKIEI